MRSKNIYMIGIKGVGMTMLAQFLSLKGHKVSGSDVKDIFLTDKVLAQSKIKINFPFSPDNVPEDPNIIIYSSAFNIENNPELAFLLKNKEKYRETEIFSFAEALGRLFNDYIGIAVCGSHGKTTVSAWLGYVLFKAGKSPNILVGSRVPQFRGSSLLGKSKLFVAEVDEYQNKLRYFNPYGVLLNNIDYDHPDFFKTEKEYVKVFRDFVKKIPKNGFLIINNQDKNSRLLIKNCLGQVINYEVSDKGSSQATVNYLAHSLTIKNNYQFFQVNNLGEFKIKLWGRHNLSNALAVIAAARELKVPLEKIKRYLAEFSGTVRRSQILGKYKQALIIDDYAHHPTEIKATISGLRDRYPKQRLRVIFHPHTFTRTKALFADFVTSFYLADEVIILDIYGSAREKQGGVSSRQLAQAIRNYNRCHKVDQAVKNIKDIKETVSYLRLSAKKNEIILLMGAGDVFRVGEELLKKKGKNNRKRKVS
jgi:UDP-N-acetylmuramate--alanine ligase